jgi:hypothetical protein
MNLDAWFLYFGGASHDNWDKPELNFFLNARQGSYFFGDWDDMMDMNKLSSNGPYFFSN